MHGLSEHEFIESMAAFLGFYYLILAAMNAIAAFYLWKRLHSGKEALTWLAASAVFLILSPYAMSGLPPKLPEAVKSGIDAVMSSATIYSIATLALLVVLFVWRRFVTRPKVAWSALNLSLLFMGLSMTDPDFAAIVTKPDNVPIVALIYLLGFFTWLATYKAIENDDRLARGLPPREKEDSDKVLVWPDLVYTEMICMVVVTAVLLFWAIGLKAPLEVPASAVDTPNPSKAPWYFLGLQEMLVYFDPWMAGVVLPSLIVFGLMAIPYIDFNKKGNGYYTINDRKFAYCMFQFGFLQLWVTLIILGTFLRGPNWNLFGPYEYWDAHKVLALNNVNLSEIVWVIWLQRGLPTAPTGADALTQLGYIVLRESPGIVLTLGYLILLPPLMAATLFRNFFVKMGFIRYMIMANLLLFMAMLPIKMVLRWTMNLKYIIAIPEYFLNL